ncbi:MAG: chemotaxis protein [Planctomycetota bacterium]
MPIQADNANLTPGDILLDAGTNELETLIFVLGGGHFGVNVAKVREVVRWTEPTESPNRHPSVLGMINLRGKVIPLVDLGKHLEIEGAGVCEEERRIVITEFNGLLCGFAVDGVRSIHRLSWSKVRPAPELDGLGSNEHGKAINACTGLIDLDDTLVLMLDFESVADSIIVQESLHITEVENVSGIDRASKRVLLAEDSPFMRELMAKVFRSSGYAKLEAYSNGLTAWQALDRSIKDEETPFDCVISDIEMPQVDGLHLCKRVKEHPQLRNTPVLLFSSLISKDNMKKGKQVGADYQVPKPALPDMVKMVDRLLTGEPVEYPDVA